MFILEGMLSIYYKRKFKNEINKITTDKDKIQNYIIHLNKEFIKENIEDFIWTNNSYDLDVLRIILEYIDENGYIDWWIGCIFYSTISTKYDFIKRFFIHFLNDRTKKININIYKFCFEIFNFDSFILEKFNITSTYNSDQTDEYYFNNGMIDKIKNLDNFPQLTYQKDINRISCDILNYLIKTNDKTQIKELGDKINSLYLTRNEKEVCLICQEIPKYYLMCQNNHPVCNVCQNAYKKNLCCVCKIELNKVFYENDIKLII